jgi:hypothetical protein
MFDLSSEAIEVCESKCGWRADRSCVMTIAPKCKEGLQEKQAR